MRKAMSQSETWGHRAERRSGDEGDEAYPKDALASEAVGERRREHQEGGEHQSVGVDDPRQSGCADMEVWRATPNRRATSVTVAPSNTSNTA
jgi:hypothetical protein